MSDIVAFFDSSPFIIGMTIFLILYLLQTPILTFPTYFLMVYSGMIYGFWIGSLINIAGMFLTTTFGYFLGNMGKGEKLLQNPALTKFDNWLQKNGMKSIVFLRIIPIIPYNVVSIGSGLLKLDRKKYLTINSIAIIPYPIIWSLIGHLFGATLIDRLQIQLNYNLLVPTIIIIFMLGIAYIIVKDKYITHQPLKDEIVL